MANSIIQIAASFAMSAAMSYLASALMKPKGQKVFSDDRSTTIALRGSYLPLLFGRRIVAPIVAWVGDRTTRKDDSGGGSGSMLGGGQETVTYHEGAWHLLSVGPGTKLHSVISNGRILQPLAETLNSTDFPSGGEVEFDHSRGHFYVYWGEHDQPINERLGESIRVGVRSRWPGVFYIEWDNRKLGTSLVWPNMEYDIERRIESPALTGSSAWLSETSSGREDEGVNPAHMLWELLTAPYPYGMGMNPDYLDGGAFEDLGELCESEHIPFNVYIDGGQSISEVIANTLEQLDMMLPQIGSVLVPYPIREVSGTIPTITPDASVDVEPEITQQHGDIAPDSFIFNIKDRKNRFRDVPVKIDNDAQARIDQRPKVKKIDLPYICDRRTASRVAKRRMQEESVGGQGYSFTALHEARMLRPGQPFILEGVGQFRVASIQPRWNTLSCQIDALVDHFALDLGDALSENEEFNNAIAPALPDLHFFAAELPNAIAGSTPGLGVARIRANNNIVGAYVWVSANGGTYTQVGQQDIYAAGGTLNAPILLEDPDVIDIGPTITSYNGDIADVLDLSGSDLDWQSGKQSCVIGDEWFFLKRVTAVSGGWQLEGLIRARYDTAKAYHAPNAPVVIFDRNGQEILRSNLFQSGVTLDVKTQPFTDNESVDLADVTAVTVVIP